jgi:hypothetical protein
MTPRPRVVLAADWGGHRVSVMKHIDAALNELNLAVPCIRQLCAIETTDLQRVAKLWKREKARGATNTHRHPILAISIPPVNIPIAGPMPMPIPIAAFAMPRRCSGKCRAKRVQCLAGIIFVLRSGIPWEMLPQELGCGSGDLLASLARLAGSRNLAIDPFCNPGLACPCREN